MIWPKHMVLLADRDGEKALCRFRGNIIITRSILTANSLPDMDRRCVLCFEFKLGMIFDGGYVGYMARVPTVNLLPW